MEIGWGSTDGDVGNGESPNKPDRDDAAPNKLQSCEIDKEEEHPHRCEQLRKSSCAVVYGS